MTQSYPSKVNIVEVGPRDGLQNEPEQIATPHKIKFINKLADAGLTRIEATSFVHPRWVPQLSDAMDVMAQLAPRPNVAYSALVPNLKGFYRAIDSGARHIAVFTAASETFVQHNINMTVAASLENFRPIVDQSLERGMTVRGYVSTCFVCPYEGPIAKEKVLDITLKLLEMGVSEVSLGDTIGAAIPRDVRETVGYVIATVPKERIALHFHDTYGMAIANIQAGLELGISSYDASAGGLGGCPYAPGASGNVATEDVIYLMDRMGIETGVDINKVAEASEFMQRVLGRPLPSKNLQRLLNQQCHPDDKRDAFCGEEMPL